MTGLIHKVYHKQLSLVEEFFSYFIDPDALSKCKTGALLLKLEIEKNFLPVDFMFIGSKANKIVKKLGKDHTNLTDFMNRVKKIYVECEKYIQNYILKMKPCRHSLLLTFYLFALSTSSC